MTTRHDASARRRLFSRIDGPDVSILCGGVVLLFVLVVLSTSFISSAGRAGSGGVCATASSGPQYPLPDTAYASVTSYDGHGVSFSAERGTPVHSPLTGRVVRAGAAAGKTYENWVVIDSTTGVDESVVLGNMDTGILVEIGDDVTQGQQIGTVGAADGTAGLWLEAWAGGDEFSGGHDIDPLGWFRRTLPAPSGNTTAAGGCSGSIQALSQEFASGDSGVARALRTGIDAVGTPYSWGGGTLTGPSYGVDDADDPLGSGRTIDGFDCSALVRRMVYEGSEHRIVLPRTAQEQYTATKRHRVSFRSLRPGDLLFWGRDGHVYHVAMYLGDGDMIAAPTTGQDVKVEPVWGPPDYATRLDLG